MSKKVKCAECENKTFWSLPIKVSDNNYEYAKHCLVVAKRSLVCGHTMKTKYINNEQYCKNFKKSTSDFYDKENIKRIKSLEESIAEYEKNK